MNPNYIIKNIEKITEQPQLYFISFRDCAMLYENFVIHFYPFVWECFEITEYYNAYLQILDDPNNYGVTEDTLNNYRGFLRTLCDLNPEKYHWEKATLSNLSPCYLYEKVSGDKIHQDNDADKYKMNQPKSFYNNETKKLINKIKAKIRKMKLETIKPDYNETRR